MQNKLITPHILDSWNKLYDYCVYGYEEEKHYIEWFAEENDMQDTDVVDIENTEKLDPEHIYRDLRILNDFFNKIESPPLPLDYSSTIAKNQNDDVPEKVSN